MSVLQTLKATIEVVIFVNSKATKSLLLLEHEQRHKDGSTSTIIYVQGASCKSLKNLAIYKYVAMSVR